MKGLSCKFSKEELIEIEELWADGNGMSQTDIAQKFNTSKQYIHILLRHKCVPYDRAPTYKPPTKEEIIKKFHSLYRITSTDCWQWIGADNGLGYGRYIGMLAHRFSWELHNGPIPDKLDILHKCDNRKCVNPSHLYLGTDADNALDRKAIRYKIDDIRQLEKMVKIVEFLPKNIHPTKSDVCSKFKISAMTLWRMRNSKQWPCIDGVYQFNW